MLYGPHKITKVRQVAIPADLLTAVGLQVGDSIHFKISDEDPYVIEILASDTVMRRYRIGADSDALDRLTDQADADQR